MNRQELGLGCPSLQELGNGPSDGDAHHTRQLIPYVNFDIIACRKLRAGSPLLNLHVKTHRADHRIEILARVYISSGSEQSGGVELRQFP